MSVPAGWYDDVEVPGGLRYWDGGQWTDHRAIRPAIPAPEPTVASAVATPHNVAPNIVSAADVTPAVVTDEIAAEKRRKLGRGAKIGLGVGVGVLTLAGVGAALGGIGSGSSTDLAVAPSQGSVSDGGSTQSPADPSASTSDAPTPTAQVPSSMTLSQEQAVQAAESYLSMDSGFSYVGLLQQLMSPVADAFSKADAQFAIDYLKPDWNGQAIIAAKQYLSGGNGFSRAALIQQLTSSAGSGFTMKQALNAIDQLNPDWNAQAVDSAKGYLAVGGFSRQSLLEQLTSPAGAGFTKEQALYAIKKVGL